MATVKSGKQRDDYFLQRRDGMRKSILHTETRAKKLNKQLDCVVEEDLKEIKDGDITPGDTEN
jgi:hypothetical protein